MYKILRNPEIQPWMEKYTGFPPTREWQRP